MNPASTEIIGWAAAMVLLGTITFQVFVQWRSGAVAGVSPWLFTGQLIASTGFLVYSALLQNWVFVVTNAMIGVAALVGKYVDRMNRKRKAVMETLRAADTVPSTPTGASGELARSDISRRRRDAQPSDRPR